MVPFSSKKTPLQDQPISKCSKNCLFTLLQADSNGFIFQQDGAPLHWHLGVRVYLNIDVNGLVGEVVKTSLTGLGFSDPLTSLCVTFSCWVMLKTEHTVCSTSSTKNINDIKDRTTVAINTMDHDMLRRVWEEFSCRFDVVRAAGDGHIEHLQNMI